MKRKWLILGPLALFVVIQAWPVDRTNPPSDPKQEITAPPAVKAILKRSCYDCHSNETRWPLQAYVAPASWLVASDVKEARHKLNFNSWGTYETRRQARLHGEIAEVLIEGEMPPGIYLVAHADARLTPADAKTLVDWAKASETSDKAAADAADKAAETATTAAPSPK